MSSSVPGRPVYFIEATSAGVGLVVRLDGIPVLEVSGPAPAVARREVGAIVREGFNTLTVDAIGRAPPDAVPEPALEVRLAFTYRAMGVDGAETIAFVGWDTLVSTLDSTTWSRLLTHRFAGTASAAGAPFRDVPREVSRARAAVDTLLQRFVTALAKRDLADVEACLAGSITATADACALPYDVARAAALEEIVEAFADPAWSLEPLTLVTLRHDTCRGGAAVVITAADGSAPLRATTSRGTWERTPFATFAGEEALLWL